MPDKVDYTVWWFVSVLLSAQLKIMTAGSSTDQQLMKQSPKLSDPGVKDTTSMDYRRTYRFSVFVYQTDISFYVTQELELFYDILQ